MRKFKVLLAVALAVAMMSMMAPAAFAQSATFTSPLFGGISGSSSTSGGTFTGGGISATGTLSGARLTSPFGTFETPNNA